MYDDPSVDAFKAYFVRDFPYGDDFNFVMDADINRAILDTSSVINPALSSDLDSYTTHFLLLAAHNLVMNLRASSQGISGQYSGHGRRGINYECRFQPFSGPEE
jgi:hypothetical protein